MSRSKWKTFSQELNLIENKTKSRNFIITSKQLNDTIEVYNGMKYTKITVTKDMIGHRLGEYSITRKRNNIKKK